MYGGIDNIDIVGDMIANAGADDDDVDATTNENHTIYGGSGNTNTSTSTKAQLIYGGKIVTQLLSPLKHRMLLTQSLEKQVPTKSPGLPAQSSSMEAPKMIAKTPSYLVGGMTQSMDALVTI